MTTPTERDHGAGPADFADPSLHAVDDRQDRAARAAAIFKAYDIRGLVGQQLDAPMAYAIGSAAANVLQPAGPFVVGRDMRPSSPELSEAFSDGVRATGTDVIDIGLVATDQLYFASGRFDAPGAMFTASHNPAAYNGIKLCGSSAAPVSIDTGLAQIREQALQPLAGVRKRGGHRHYDISDEFVAHVHRFVNTDALSGLSVAVDAGNGMGGHVWPLVVASLGIRTTPLYFELDGTFPHHPPDPLNPANLADLSQELRARPHDVGLAFDGDADRVFVLDETGAPVSASIVGALIARRMLARNPGATVLHNLICSRVVPDTIIHAGGRPVRTRVGHSFIKQVMAETDALLAVEHSGHYYYREHFRADSGIITALLVLEALASGDGPMSRQASSYSGLSHSGEINVQVVDAVTVIDEIAASFAARGTSDRLDGLTVTLDDGWFNLRPSNTEPLLRLNVEADDPVRLRGIVEEVLAMVAASPAGGRR